MVTALVVQGETGPLVDPPSVHQHVVGPQRDAGVPSPAREPEHLLDQAAPDPEPPGPRLDQQQAQARGRGVLAHAEHAPGPRPGGLPALTIGLMELTARARAMQEFTFQVFEAFTAATIIYIVINMIVTFAMRVVEQHLAVPGYLGSKPQVVTH